MSTFAVGEVAELVRDSTDPEVVYHGGVRGAEVTITDPVQASPIPWISEAVYGISLPDGVLAWCGASLLRKRRPPQDWKTLCKLNEVPSDCVSEREVQTC